MRFLPTGYLVIVAAVLSCECKGQSTPPQSEAQIQKGPLTTIPGCGNSGCNAYYNICVDVPKGATPIGITNYFDSFVGWGGFGNPRKTETGFCATYWQHSHNVARSVSFDVSYQPASSKQTATDIYETSPTAPSEEEIERKAKTGEPFTGPNGSSSRSVSGEYLQKLIEKLKDDPKVKDRGITIDGAKFEGDTRLAELTIPFPVHLRNCQFQRKFTVNHVRFDHSFVVEIAAFDDGFDIDSSSIKEDLRIDANSSISARGTIRPLDAIRDVQVDGWTEITTKDDVSASSLKTTDLDVVLFGEDQAVSFDALDANTVDIGSGLVSARVDSLGVRNGHIRTSVRVGTLNLNSFSTQLSTIERLILVGTKINKSIDLSFTNINSLSWAMGNIGTFPSDRGANDLTNLTFKSIEITRNNDTSKIDQQSSFQNHAQIATPTKTSQNPTDQQSEIASTALEMLNRSKYSPSAYDALEKFLSSRGDPKADEVFVEGREARRKSEPRGLGFVLDLFQEYVLGYGRIVRYPVLWSVILIIIGGLVFAYNSKVKKMERTKEAEDSDSPYSPFWYSFELFVPVIDVGVAKKWRPKPEYYFLTNYARFQQIAGWILIPVIIGVLTGITK